MAIFVTMLPNTTYAKETLSSNAIINKANCVSYYQAKDGKARASMVITDDQGRKRKRKLTILRRDVDTNNKETTSCGNQQYYIYFHRPADLNKMVFMVWKNVVGNDDRWLYLPALDLVKRIAASDKRTSFAGSHFFYEDVSGRNTTEDNHTLIDTTDEYYVLKSVPKIAGSVEFSSYKSWIHKSTFLPVKVEYYDKNDRVYRIYEALNVEMVDQYPTITRARMRDIERGGDTTISYSKIAYDQGYPESIFTERYLRNSPRKYLR
jgi:outer membrane lipoprotein-sorting protein